MQCEPSRVDPNRERRWIPGDTTIPDLATTRIVAPYQCLSSPDKVLQLLGGGIPWLGTLHARGCGCLVSASCCNSLCFPLFQSAELERPISLPIGEEKRIPDEADCTKNVRISHGPCSTWLLRHQEFNLSRIRAKY